MDETKYSYDTLYGIVKFFISQVDITPEGWKVDCVLPDDVMYAMYDIALDEMKKAVREGKFEPTMVYDIEPFTPDIKNDGSFFARLMFERTYPNFSPFINQVQIKDTIHRIAESRIKMAENKTQIKEEK